MFNDFIFHKGKFSHEIYEISSYENFGLYEMSIVCKVTFHLLNKVKKLWSAGLQKKLKKQEIKVSHSLVIKGRWTYSIQVHKRFQLLAHRQLLTFTKG